MTRRSLRDRNRAAIALDPETDTETRSSVEPADQSSPTKLTTAETANEPQGTPREPVRAPVKTSVTKRSAPTREAATTAVSATARLGIYLTPEEFDNAKAGYLADWSNGGEADTFARWIAGAIDSYAGRTPAVRANAKPRGRSEERTGSTRSFSVPHATVARMRAAITADQQAGRWPSDSAWCGEAIAAAVDQARTTNGGSLPTPPPRLPNRLVR